MTNLAIEAAKRLLGTSNSSLRGEIPIKKEEPVVAGQLNEELTPAHQRKADKMKESGHDYYQDQFILNHAAPGTYQKFQYDENSGHKVIRIPVSLNQDKTEPSHTVKNFLEDKGYHIRDTDSYRKGIVHKSVVTGNPDKGIPYRNKWVQHKIGGILEKENAPDHVMQAFQHDPVRVGAGKHDYDLVIANHHHDVYGMSTGQGWTSCADMDNPKGFAAQHMKDEINNHTHVAYLVDRGGDYNKNAIARLAFKHHTALTAKSDANPHINHETLIPESRVYGQAPTDFRNVAEHEMGKLFPIKNDIYVKNQNVYNDDQKTLHVPEGVQVPAEALDEAWKKVPKDSKHRLYEYVHTDGKYKSKKLREVQGALKDIMHEPTGNFQDDIGRIRESTYGLDDEQIRNGIDGNKNYDYDSIREHMGKVMKGFDIHNPDHHMELRAFKYEHPMRNRLYAGISKNIPVIKTAQDFVTGNAIHKMLGNREHDALPVHPEHVLGDDPVKALANAGALHDVNDFRKAYYTFNKGKENLYSLAHRLNEDKVPNAHLLLNDSIESLRKYKDNGNMGEMNLALAYSRMTPNAKHFYSNELGHDPDQIIERQKEYLKRFE